MTGPYDDIINLPHHVSATRPQMSRVNRAAQFSPFAALTGYDAAIQETARLTDARMELEEDAKAAIDLMLRVLADTVADHPVIAVTYFLEDGKKDGGAYVKVVGAVKKLDEDAKAIVLKDGGRIPIKDIVHMEWAP